MRAEFILLDWICIDEGKAVIVFVGDQRRRLYPIRLSQLPNTHTRVAVVVAELKDRKAVLHHQHDRNSQSRSTNWFG